MWELSIGKLYKWWRKWSGVKYKIERKRLGKREAVYDTCDAQASGLHGQAQSPEGLKPRQPSPSPKSLSPAEPLHQYFRESLTRQCGTYRLEPGWNQIVAPYEPLLRTASFLLNLLFPFLYLTPDHSLHNYLIYLWIILAFSRGFHKVL